MNLPSSRRAFLKRNPLTVAALGLIPALGPRAWAGPKKLPFMISLAEWSLHRTLADKKMDRAADGLRQLAQHAAKHGLNVIVENHGHLSSNGAWLAGVMKKVNLPNCGTLPDFGNFQISETETYDRYKGVAEMMPYAKAVSAKSHDFDADGNEVHTDYRRMLKIVTDAGYRGYLGIEYEGDKLSEADGIRATKRLLEKVRTEMEAAPSAVRP